MVNKNLVFIFFSVFMFNFSISMRQSFKEFKYSNDHEEDIKFKNKRLRQSYKMNWAIERLDVDNVLNLLNKNCFLKNQKEEFLLVILNRYKILKEKASVAQSEGKEERYDYITCSQIPKLDQIRDLIEIKVKK